jgi:DNA-binding NarL/FixJ family response regulator
MLGEIPRQRTVSGARQALRRGSVLIVEDHPVVAFGTAEVVRRRHPHLAPDIAIDAGDALRRIDEKDWSWILLDLALPGAHGLSLVHAVHARGHAPRCCVVSASGEPDAILEVRHLGFAGYIEKRVPFDDFCSALDQLLRGHPVFPRIEHRRFQPSVALTCRQVGILRQIQRGLAAKQIAVELAIAEGTVRNHTLAILRALGVNNRTHAVARAIDLGLLPATLITS